MGVSEADIQAFIDRWQASGAAERANYQLFLAELCDLIAVEHPHPKKPQEPENTYVFEKAVPSPHGTTNFIDLYKRGCFVLEAKQGSDQADDKPAFSAAALQQKKAAKKGTAVRGTAGWDTAMEKARQQAQSYARNLPQVEIENGRPPFILVVDVGNSIHIYSEFTRTGGNYVPFPDPNSYRLTLDDLHDANVRSLLHTIWTEPMALDPSRRSARVTRGDCRPPGAAGPVVGGQYEPELVAQFLMRCLFTMFAEDVALLPNRSFMQLLADIRQDPVSFKPMLEHLWKTMNTGGFSVILRQQLPQFNGGLFADHTALPLDADQVQLLVEAAQADWRDVEPAIFGTLLERALDPVERHKLGAHYTPRAYVERLVQPTVIEPLRAEWESVQAAAALYADAGQADKAIAEVKAFHLKLATLRVLDPACGSGNFLYVTLELMKRLEGEVLNTLRELGEGQMQLEIEGVMITPQQFLGIEVNPRAAAIAELVLWIGFLQWHLRTRGETKPPEPIIKNYHNIECRDAVLAWDAIEPLLDEEGRPVTRWDG
ncbi:MAG: class I SAM-dependent DNA methyltransferase, partial [Chloroflexi bacterium]|nr:class I SAM-dependent DNA methyltransferase [Chloroflexota bacterium]